MGTDTKSTKTAARAKGEKFTKAHKVAKTAVHVELGALHGAKAATKMKLVVNGEDVVVGKVAMDALRSMVGRGKAETLPPGPIKSLMLRVEAAPSFYRLNKRFPLRGIRTVEEYAAALRVAEELVGREDLDVGESDYLGTLSDIIHKHESEAYPIPDASEADVLGLLMEGKGVSQTEVEAETGIQQSTLSTVLKGKRALTKQHVVALAKYFGVSPAVFLPRGS